MKNGVYGRRKYRLVYTGGRGGTLLLSSTGAHGVESIIDGLPSVSYTLPIPHFSVIYYKRTGYCQCMIISLHECQINELAH